ncbi:MAG: biosynthetic-type acetolactate synthase large subunit [bacterium]|nr:biosynthetic-type acetolactate synthase large subunit [bacterium]
MKKTGAKIFVETLLEHGVNTIFGYPGGVLLPIYDELYHAPIRHILTRHEQGAIHAADGYARVSGKVGVCMATSGPGATNLVTGLATAFMDSVPVVAFTGQVSTHLLGNDSFQEADIYGISIPITKYNYLVKDTARLKEVMYEAFYLATSGRPGPVLIDLPKDVQTTQIDEPKLPELTLPLKGPHYTPEERKRQLELILSLISKAERPVIYAGGGVIKSEGAEKALRHLAEKAKIPVTTTLMGKGAFPETHPLSLGMLGMHGTRYANYAVAKCDLLIAVGARFDDRVTGEPSTFAREAKIVHLDIDPAEVGKIIQVDAYLIGQAKDLLQELAEGIEPQGLASHEEWLLQIDQWKRDFPLSYPKKEGVISPQYVVEQIYEKTQGEAIITTEVGQNQMWAAQYYKCSRPRSFISSGGLGTMGYGFPAAIGAKIACPDRIVFDIAGDGSFQMNIQELATAVYNKVNVKVAILNNGFLGMVRQWQELFYGRRYSQTRLSGNPDFVKIAEGYGALGLRVETPEEVPLAIERAIAEDRPVVIDFHVDPEENVYPMVPPGGAINDMLDRKEK